MSMIIESRRNSSKKDLEATVSALREKISRIHKKMRLLARKLRYDDNMDSRDLDEYQRLNKELKDAKVWEAEMAYTRNML